MMTSATTVAGVSSYGHDGDNQRKYRSTADRCGPCDVERDADGQRQRHGQRRWADVHGRAGADVQRHLPGRGCDHPERIGRDGRVRRGGAACSGTGACTVTLSAATLVVATFNLPPPTVTQFYHMDVLGSVRAVTGADGAVLRRHDYAPFGEDLHTEEAEPGLPYVAKQQRFTGKERDGDSGLDYFGAGYYGAGWGRFISARWGQRSSRTFQVRDVITLSALAATGECAGGPSPLGRIRMITSCGAGTRSRPSFHRGAESTIFVWQNPRSRV